MRVLLWAVLFLGYLSASAELVISCEVKGRNLPIAGTDGKSIFLQSDDERIAAPADALWTIEGDLRSEQAQLCWSPTYSLVRAAPEKNVPRSKSGSYVATVSGLQTAFLKAPVFSVGSNRWPKLVGHPAVLFTGWLSGGKMSHVSASPISARPRALAFAATTTTYLAPEEVKGQPVILLWQDGQVVPPLPHFADEAMNRAWYAVMRDDVDALKLLLAPAKLKTLNSVGWSLLHYAAEAGSEHAAQLLIETDKTLVSSGEGGDTPLGVAARLGRTKMVELLLAAGASKNVLDARGISPLHGAARGGHLTTVNSLLKAHALVSTLSEDHETPFAAAITHGYGDVAAALYAAGGKLDVGRILPPDVPVAYNIFADDPRFQRVLLTRAQYNDLDTVGWLLDRGVSTESTELGATPLVVAAENADGDVATLLIRAGAKPNRANAEGLTALMRAAFFGNLDYARALLDGGADVNTVDAKRRSALHFAAGHGQVDLAALFLERGADLSLRDVKGYSALDRALLGGAAETVELLSKRGARIDVKSTHLKVIIEAAIVMDRADLLAEAIKGGWSLGDFGEKGWTGLQAAQLSKANQCLPLFEPSTMGKQVGAAGIVPSKQLDAPLKAEKMKSPENPRMLKAYSTESVRILVSCVVDTDGAVKFPRVLGPANPILASSVLDAVRDWHFSSPKKDGKAVATTVVVPFDFSFNHKDEPSLATVDEQPVPISQVKPIYPNLDRSIEGRVTASFTITAAGDVTAVEIEGASSPALVQASQEAVEKWKFKPAVLDGKPINVRTAVPLVFSLID